MNKADELIKRLRRTPHPEGGHYRETFRDSDTADGRAYSTAIYFLLKQGEVSKWHRIDAVEIWHWYAGSPLALRIAQDGGRAGEFVLGPDVAAGQEPQVVVPKHAWQSAEPLGEYALVGCTVAPGFMFEHFEMAGDKADFMGCRVEAC
jgi:predicted cupin superfamily sugar epimerase